MSLFGGFMRDFDDDPFFGFPNMTNNMGDLNSMINSMVSDHCNLFGGFDLLGRRGRQNQLMPFGFPDVNNIFENFQMNANSPNCHSFSSSTVMTMSSGPDGRPQVYQASQSTRTAPGGIRETKKSVCDSRTGTKKLAIGHHIGDRAHVLEREQNIHSGQQEERQEFINLDEEEAEDFNREWESRTRASMNAIGYNGHHRSHSRRPREDLPAIQDRYRPRARITPRRHYYPAITSSPRILAAARDRIGEYTKEYLEIVAAAKGLCKEKMPGSEFISRFLEYLPNFAGHTIECMIDSSERNMERGRKRNHKKQVSPDEEEVVITKKSNHQRKSS